MQFIVISDQLVSVAWALLLGAVLALCYDGLRILRMPIFSDGVRVIPFLRRLPAVTLPESGTGSVPELILINVFDVLYSVFAAAAFSVFIFHFNSGHFRWYIFLSSVAGFALYRLSIGRLVMLCAGYTAGILRVAFGFFLWLLLRPAVLLFRLIKAAVSPVAERVRLLAGKKRTERIRKRLPTQVRFH